MDKEYDVKVEVMHGKYTHLLVTHSGSQWSSISINDAELEIPLIILALQHHLTNAIHSDARKQCPSCVDADLVDVPTCPKCGYFERQ